MKINIRGERKIVGKIYIRDIIKIRDTTIGIRGRLVSGVDWFRGRLVDWFRGRLVDWFRGRLVPGSIGSGVDWYPGSIGTHTKVGMTGV